HVDRFLVHGPTEGEVRVLQVREQLTEGTRIDHRAREIVLPQRLGLLEYADVQLVAVLLSHARQLDGAGETRRASPDDADVELHRIPGAFGARLEDQAVEGQRGLVLRRLH